MYARGFRLIAFGLLLVLFDIHVFLNNGEVDILPDWIGYLLIISGSVALSQSLSVNYFSRAKMPAVLLLAVYLFQVFSKNTIEMNETPPFLPIGLFSIITSILSIFLVYYILKGTEQYALERGNSSLVLAAKRDRTVYLIINIVILFSTQLVFVIGSSLLAPIMFLSVISNIVIMLFIIYLLFSAAKLPQQPASNSDCES